MSDSTPPEQLRAADLYDATREARVYHCLRGASRVDGPLFDRLRSAERARRDPDDEAAKRRDLEEA